MSVTAADRVDPTRKGDVAEIAAGVAVLAETINKEHGDKLGGVGTALPPNRTAAEWTAHIERIGDRGGLFYCKDGNEVVAFAVLQPDQVEADTLTMGVWVRESHRRRGIGIELARACAEFAKSTGFTKLRGTIPAYNEPALSFFSAIGPIVQLSGGGMAYELPV